jgi:hypothetical protein
MLRVQAEVYWYLSQFAHKGKEIRPGIQGVYFDPILHGYRGVSSDGHRMAIVNVLHEYSKDTKVEKPILIKLVADMIKVCKPGKYDKFLEINNEGIAKVYQGELVLYVSPTSVISDNEFPPYRQVVPDNNAYMSTTCDPFVQINPALLDGFDYDCDDMQIYLSKPLDPVVVHTTFQLMPVLGIIMPSRACKHDESFPGINCNSFKS